MNELDLGTDKNSLKEPEVLEGLGRIGTGMTSGIKSTAGNATQRNKQRAQLELEQAKVAAQNMPKGAILYRKLGDPVFNCSTEGGKPIKFLGGQFIAETQEQKDALDYHVQCGRLVKEKQD